MKMDLEAVGFRHIALDLELEQPKTRVDTQDSQLDEEKIIQVGYIIYELEPEFKILKEVSLFVNIGVPLSAYIKKLTGISNEQIASGGTIEEAYQQLVSDTKEFDCIRVVKQWGGGDIEWLQKEVPNEKWEFGRSGCNIKHLYQIYAEANGKNRSGGQKKCMKRCGLTFDGSTHNAAVDALNTAKFHAFFHRVNKGKNE